MGVAKMNRIFLFSKNELVICEVLKGLEVGRGDNLQLFIYPLLKYGE